MNFEIVIIVMSIFQFGSILVLGSAFRGAMRLVEVREEKHDQTLKEKRHEAAQERAALEEKLLVMMDPVKYQVYKAEQGSGGTIGYIEEDNLDTVDPEAIVPIDPLGKEEDDNG